MSSVLHAAPGFRIRHATTPLVFREVWGWQQHCGKAPGGVEATGDRRVVGRVDGGGHCVN